MSVYFRYQDFVLLICLSTWMLLFHLISDHIALLNAFNKWKDAKRKGNDRAFCWENFLSPVTLQMMDDMRKQFLDLLSDIGFVNKSKISNVRFSIL